MAEINKDTTYYLECLVTDKNGDGAVLASGEVVTYKVIRSDTNTTVASGSLTDVGDGVHQGSYYFDTLGQYRVIYETPTKYVNSMETVNVLNFGTGGGAGSGLDADKLNRILGLVHENIRIEQPVYNKTGDLTDGVITLYPSATDLENDTNAIAVYEIKTQYKPGSKRLVEEYICKRIA